MKIKGTVEYNNNGKTTEARIDWDTAVPAVDLSDREADAISFALFGKTVFQPIIRAEGVPFIVLEIECDGKTISVARQPEYTRETAFEGRHLAKQLFSIKTEKAEYPSLSSEKYYALIKEYIPFSYEDFVALFHS